MAAKIDTVFKTPYGKRERYYVSSGNAIQKEYQHVVDKYGKKSLEECGERNIYEEIQAQHDETKIENVLARVTAGDTSALRPDGIYGDLTKMPKTLMEAQQVIQDMQNQWSRLPIEIRREYNHDVGQFVADAGSEHWLKIMGLNNEDAKETAKTIKETAKAEAAKPEVKTEVEGITA